MAIYAVHCALDTRAPEKALARARLLRLGFAWPAALLGPVWLAARGLWLALILWVVLAMLAGAATSSGLLSGAGDFWLYVLSALYLGFEGRSMQSAALARGGRPLADLVCASDLTSAERAFFAPRLDASARPSSPAGAPPTGGAPPHVLGLFPEAGG